MPKDFIRRFESAWLSPTPERLADLLHPDVVLYQPHRPPIRGRAAAHADFTRLLQWLPGLHSLLISTSGQEQGKPLFIEHELVIPLRRSRISIPAVDRFRLKDDLAIERVVYFDQARLAAAVLRHPRLLAGLFRYRAERHPARSEPQAEAGR